MNLLNVNLNLYKSFYYVAKYEGFSNASRVMHISQSSLSSSIKNLEDNLGVFLFNREGQKIYLTSYGKDLYKKIKAVRQIMSTNILKENLTIGCIRFIADNYLDIAISKFKENHKDIQIQIIYSDATNLFHMLKKDELDLIVCRYPRFYKFEPNIAVEKIRDVMNVFACSTKLYKQLIRINDVDFAYPLLLPNNSEKRRIVEQYLLENKINFQVEVELPNSELLKKLILDGVGIGYINKKSISSLLDDGSVKIFDKFSNVPLDNVSVIYDSNKKMDSLDDFISILKKAIGDIEN